MAVNTVSFTAPGSASAPLGGARAEQLAYLLKNQPQVDYSSVQSPLEGLAKMLTSGIQGWEAGAVARSNEGKRTAQAQSLADLLAPPINPDGTPNPKNRQLVGLLSSGALSPDSFGDEVATKLGFGKAAAPIKLGAGDTLYDPAGGKAIYTAPAAPPAPKVPTPYSDVAQINADVRAGFLSPEDGQREIARITQAAVAKWPTPYTDIAKVQADVRAGLISPEQAQTEIARLTAGKAPEPFTLSPGQVRYNPDGTQIATGPTAPAPRPATPDEKRAYNVAPDAPLYIDGNGTPHILSAGGTTINNNIGPSGIDYGEPEKGLAWARNPDGSVKLDERGAPIAVPYQGGSVAREEADAKAKAALGEQAQTQTANIVLDAIDRAVPMIQARPAVTTGVIGSLSQNIPGTPAFDVNQLLQTVRANVGFDKLQAMRAASPTGGALGQVSTFETKLLQAVFGSMEQAQSTDQLLYNLRRIRNGFADVQNGGKLSEIGRMVDAGQITAEEGARRAQAILDGAPATSGNDPLGLFAK